jgi:hypothetical protein
MAYKVALLVQRVLLRYVLGPGSRKNAVRNDVVDVLVGICGNIIEGIVNVEYTRAGRARQQYKMRLISARISF